MISGKDQGYHNHKKNAFDVIFCRHVSRKPIKQLNGRYTRTIFIESKAICRKTRLKLDKVNLIKIKKETKRVQSQKLMEADTKNQKGDYKQTTIK